MSDELPDVQAEAWRIIGEARDAVRSGEALKWIEAPGDDTARAVIVELAVILVWVIEDLEGQGVVTNLAEHLADWRAREHLSFELRDLPDGDPPGMTPPA